MLLLFKNGESNFDGDVGYILLELPCCDELRDLAKTCFRLLIIVLCCGFYSANFKYGLPHLTVTTSRSGVPC